MFGILPPSWIPSSKTEQVLGRTIRANSHILSRTEEDDQTKPTEESDADDARSQGELQRGSLVMIVCIEEPDDLNIEVLRELVSQSSQDEVFPILDLVNSDTEGSSP